MDTHLIQTPHYYGQFSLSLALTFSLNSICLIQMPINTDTFYAPTPVSILTGLTVRIKSREKKKSVSFVSKADIIAIRINQIVTIPVHVYLYFFHLLLSTAIVKNPNSPMLFHYLTLQLNWTRWVYNTLWGQPGTCIILLVSILVNFVLIAIYWFCLSHVSSWEMTRIAK